MPLLTLVPPARPRLFWTKAASNYIVVILLRDHCTGKDATRLRSHLFSLKKKADWKAACQASDETNQVRLKKHCRHVNRAQPSSTRRIILQVPVVRYTLCIQITKVTIHYAVSHHVLNRQVCTYKNPDTRVLTLGRVHLVTTQQALRPLD